MKLRFKNLPQIPSHERKKAEKTNKIIQLYQKKEKISTFFSPNPRF